MIVQYHKMKTFIANPSFSRVAGLSTSVMFVLTFGLLQSYGEPGRVEVRAVKGRAAYTTTDQPSAPLKAGSTLYPGTVIKTANESTVDLFLGRAGVVRILENTTLGIDVLDRVDTGVDEIHNVQLDLSAGTILGNVSKLSRASKYEIKLPGGIAGIRGTRYRCTADGRRTKILLLDGTMVFVPVTVPGPVGTPLVLIAPPAIEYDSDAGGQKPAPVEVIDEAVRQMPPLVRPTAPGPVVRTEVFVQPVHAANKNVNNEPISPTTGESNTGGNRE